MALSDSLQKVQQLPEGKRRFFMLVSMIVFSFLVLAIAWKSFERNLGIRLGSAPEENGEVTPGPLQSLIEDIKRIAGGEEPIREQTQTAEQTDANSTTLEKIFSVARETRRVVKYNVGEISVWARETAAWFQGKLQ
ncbi:MAG: hypothetical protein Q7R73_03135 [bacterium]|nr:hypothetical protein [bacterium]